MPFLWEAVATPPDWSRDLMPNVVSGLLNVCFRIVAIVSTFSTQLDSFDDRQCADRNFGTPSI